MLDYIGTAVDKLQHSFNVLQSAFYNHKLVLNVEKTKFMLFSRASNIDFSTFKITTLKGSDIERVSEYKYFGIQLEDKCTLKHHINMLMCQLRQKPGFMYRN